MAAQAQGARAVIVMDHKVSDVRRVSVSNEEVALSR